MNTATSTSTATTITLNEGFFSRRNWLDWLFAAIVAVGAPASWTATNPDLAISPNPSRICS